MAAAPPQSNIRPEQAIQVALLKLIQDNGKEQLGYQSDLVELMEELVDHEVPIAGLTFRRTSRGLVSDEVWEYIGRLALSGFVRQESPIRLSDEGYELILRSVVTALENENSATVRKALGILGLKEEEVKEKAIRQEELFAAA